MRLDITGRHIEITPALRQFTEEKLVKLERLLEGPVEVHVVLEIEIGGLVPRDEHDQLIVTGTATLDGTLSVALIDDFVPLISETFTVMTYGSVSGIFCSLLVPDGPEEPSPELGVY